MHYADQQPKRAGMFKLRMVRAAVTQFLSGHASVNINQASRKRGKRGKSGSAATKKTPVSKSVSASDSQIDRFCYMTGIKTVTSYPDLSEAMNTRPPMRC